MQNPVPTNAADPLVGSRSTEVKMPKLHSAEMPNISWAERFYQSIASMFEAHSLANPLNKVVAFRVGVPIYYVQLVLSMEDKRFWWHPGIDPIGIGRAFLMKTRKRGRRQGASTIPEQVVKLRRQKSRPVDFIQRAYRALLSVQLIGRESKVNILSEYLERVYLGRASYGVAAAAQAYFQCSHSQLTPAQSFFISERIALPNKCRPARLANILRRSNIRNIIGKDLINLPSIYGTFFGTHAEAEVSKICIEMDINDEG